MSDDPHSFLLALILLFFHSGGLLLQGKQQFNPSHFTPHHKKERGNKAQHPHERALLRGAVAGEGEEKENPLV